jgi:hypothetical protein
MHECLALDLYSAYVLQLIAACGCWVTGQNFEGSRPLQLVAGSLARPLGHIIRF